MPLYAYKCSVCGLVVELQRKIAERDEPVQCTRARDHKVGAVTIDPPNMVRIPVMPSPTFPGAASWRG